MPPVHLMLKPASAGCNMRCKYCFYADEAACREESQRGIMSKETAKTAIQKTLAYAKDACTFAFQGGEPTLAGLDFFREFVEIVRKENKRRIPVSYAFQTNGLAVNEEWADFFAANHVLVGISIDGTEDVHDLLRPKADGTGTHAIVFEHLKMLRQAGVECNTLTVVTKQLARNIAQTYRFFTENGVDFQQYIPCMDPLGETRGTHAYSLSSKEYAKFLHRLFCLWQKDLERGKYVSVRHFDNWLSILMGYPPESCNMRGQCSIQYVMEADGSVYPCDFYCLDQWLLGNIHQDDFLAFDRRRKELGFVERSQLVPEECKKCDWYALCRNGCPRDRVELAGQTIPKNYFCEAHREFFGLHIRDMENAACLIAKQNPGR